MALRFLARRYNSELRPNQDLSALLSCVGEKVVIETDFYYENVSVSSSDNEIYLVPDISLAGTLDVQSMVLCKDTEFISTLKVGDELFIEDKTDPLLETNSSIVGPYYVKEILDPNRFRVTVNFVRSAKFSEDTDDVGYMAVTTPQKGVKYAHIFTDVESSDFLSLIDEEYQQFVVDNADSSSATFLPMTPTGIKSYQIGNMSIKGDATPNEFRRQYFTVRHETVITPFFLTDQYDDLLLRIAPEYFLAKKCLNYSTKISVGKTLTDPNLMTDLAIPEQIGNTGWFNENLNGMPTAYVIDSMVMTRLSDSEVVHQLQFDEDIEIKIKITNPNVSFHGYDSVVFGFNYLPEDPILYANNGYDQTRNFLFESKKSGVGSPEVNGDNFSTPLQVIKTIQTEFTSSTEINITVVIRFGSEAKSILSQGDFMRYMFWVICDNAGLVADKMDKVNLLLQVDEIYVKKIKTDLVVADTVFIEHPYDESQFGQETLEMFPTDDVVANTTLSIDYTDPLVMNGNVRIQSVTPRIKLKKTGQTDITLESFKINTGNYPLILGTPDLQDIFFKQSRVFKREEGIRKDVVFGNDPSNSIPASDFYTWALSYPFMNRWEYFLPLIGQSNIPSELRDTSLPFNGINNLWNRLCNVSGWDLFYEISVNIIQNGVLFEQIFSDQISSVYFGANPDWTNNSIKSFDVVTSQEIINVGVQYIQGYASSKIVATFEKTTGPVPPLDMVAMVVWMEPFEGAGISDIRMISSVYPLIEESWFASIDNTNLLKIEKIGSVFTGTCLIDNKKLPNNGKFTLYARIYELSGDALNVRITNDLIVRKLMDGTTRLYI